MKCTNREGFMNNLIRYYCFSRSKRSVFVVVAFILRRDSDIIYTIHH